MGHCASVQAPDQYTPKTLWQAGHWREMSRPSGARVLHPSWPAASQVSGADRAPWRRDLRAHWQLPAQVCPKFTVREPCLCEREIWKQTGRDSRPPSWGLGGGGGGGANRPAGSAS